MEKKNFDEWNTIKKRMHAASNMPRIKEGEVYWCGCGENVGVEINGKNELFSRPVLILKKLSKYGFLGVPLTSKLHYGTWYVLFNFQGRRQVAVLSQQRTYSVARLYDRMGQVDDMDLARIKEGFKQSYCE